MASTLAYFMTPEDEVAFLRALEPLHLEVYAEACPRNFEPFAASAANASRLEDEAYYLVLPEAGEPLLREIRRGPHRGMLELDEVRSAAFHFERSLLDEDGVLRSGRLWGELDVLGDRQKRLTKPDLLRRTFDEIRSYLKKRHLRSEPGGYFVGPVAARRAREGLQLREAGRKGELIVPYR